MRLLRCEHKVISWVELREESRTHIPLQHSSPTVECHKIVVITYIYVCVYIYTHTCIYVFVCYGSVMACVAPCMSLMCV